MLMLSACSGDMGQRPQEVDDGDCASEVVLESVPMDTAVPDHEWRGAAHETEEVKAIAVNDAGNLYVVDGMAGQVYELTLHGDLIRKVGRQGDGPGEFRYPTAVGVLESQSVAVFDGDLWRVTTIRPPTYEVTTAPIPPMGNFGQAATVAIARDGSVYALDYYEYQATVAEPLGGRRKGIGQGQVALSQLDTAAWTWRHIISVPGEEAFVDADNRLLQDIWFGAKANLLVTDNAIWSADGRSGVVYHIALDKDRSCQATIRYDDVIVAEEERDSFYDARDREYSGEARVSSIRAQRRTVSLPDFKARIADLRPGDGNNVWVRLANHRGRPAHWLALSDSLEPQALVVLPAAFTILAQDGRALYGITRLDDGTGRLDKYLR
jgi:hypothetical protein